MIRFLSKGLMRDRTRSFFPLLVISLTVALVVFGSGFMRGVMNSMLLDTAVMLTGHEKIVTRAYNEESELMPNDLALLGSGELIEKLEIEYPGFFWTPRITFAGLLDVPDENGETLSQSPVIGLGVDFFSEESKQLDIWDLKDKIIEGNFLNHNDQVLLSEKLSKRLEVFPGDVVTFIGATMYGGFTTYNLKVTGIFDLNLGPVDKDMMIIDFQGAQEILDMKEENAASEILGYDKNLFFSDENTVKIRKDFNSNYSNSNDEYRPVMLALRDSNQMSTIVDFSDVIMSIILGLFLVVVTLVLWNMGIMSGLRRYGEIGMRLAIGETKGHVFKSMVIESVIIGFFGSIMGTTLGILLTSYLQRVGIDYSKAIDSLSSSNFAMPNVFYPQVTPDLFYIGFIPGILATVFGTMLAGRAIYKREMAQLFKELEA